VGEELRIRNWAAGKKYTVLQKDNQVISGRHAANLQINRPDGGFFPAFYQCICDDLSVIIRPNLQTPDSQSAFSTMVDSWFNFCYAFAVILTLSGDMGSNKLYVYPFL